MEKEKMLSCINAVGKGHENKVERRKSMDELLTYLQTINCDDDDIYNTATTILKALLSETECCLALVKNLHDSSEVNRNIATKILINLSDFGVLSCDALDMIFPALRNIMNRNIIDETSEENRLEYFFLLQAVIKNTEESKLPNYADDVVEIIKYGLLDKYSDVIFEACNTVALLGTLFHNAFKMFSNSFITYLLKNTNNRRFKIRLKSVTTLS